MPGGSYRQADVQCPFYKSDDGQRRITCEGILDDSILALVYRRKKDYETQISTFCCGCYRNCEIYGMLMEQKYT